MNGRRLYEEIGGVSERYLQQAASYRARRKNPAWRVVLIAAALMLVGALLLGTLAMSLGIILLDRLLDNDEPEQGTDTETPVLSELAQMESTLTERQAQMQPLQAEELALFRGYYTLIWREIGSDEYYSVRLSKTEMSHMLYLMQESRTEFSENSEQPAMQIWLCMGDGLVISPYLKNSSGNAGHGEVFDYDPELELSDELAEYIADCVLT